MLIGQATLKSAAFCPRLTRLIADFREAGYTVWLEGTDLRFDRADDCVGELKGQTFAQTDDLSVLMARYRDIIDWGPTAFTKAALAEPTTRVRTPPRWLRRLSGRGEGVKPG